MQQLILALDPNSFEANYFYGRASFEEGKVERAATLFERASEINKDDYQSLLLLSLSYRALGREQDAKVTARTTLERAERELTRHPEDPKPASAGGSVLIDLGDSERAFRSRATEAWRKSIEHDPDFNPLRSHPRFQKIIEVMGRKS